MPLFEKVNKWLRKRVAGFLNWFASKIYMPRLWSTLEWEELSSKEKAWIWYKHHDNLMSTGNAELDKILPFLKGEFIATTGIVAALFTLWNLPWWTIGIYPILYIGYKLFQWYVGDQIDKRDLIALSSEITTKRTIAFRELRKGIKEEEWRKTPKENPTDPKNSSED